MKKKLFLLFSLFIVTNRSSLSNSESGLIFFTNFKYFKSNEKEFKIKNSNINLPIESSEKNPTLLPPVTTPSKPNITTPSITPAPSIPNIPATKPITPTAPSGPPDYSKIFFNNNWILNTHSYTTNENLVVTPTNNLFTGMGSVENGFSIENANIIKVENGDASQDLLGMLSKNGGEIINGLSGEILVQGTGNNFGMAIVGDGTGSNLGKISVTNSQIGAYIDGDGSFTNNGTIDTSNNSTGIFSVNGGEVQNSGTINVSSNSIGIVIEGNSISNNGVNNIGNNKSIINVHDNSIGMYTSNYGEIYNNGTINVVDSTLNKSLSNSFGMYLEGDGAIFNNDTINISGGGVGILLNNSSSGSYFFNDGSAKISGDASYSVIINGQGYMENFGAIEISNGVSAILVDGSGSAYNNGNINIKNTKFALLSHDGGNVTNDIDGIINSDSNEIAKIGVIGSGSGINTGTLSSSNADYTMYLSGTGSLINNGTITSNITDNFSTHILMYGTGGGTIINKLDGIININGGDSNYAMGIEKSGSLTNNGTINVGNYQNGILLQGATTGTNNGTINFSLGSTAVSLYNSTSDTYFRNYGTIKGTAQDYQGGRYGILAFGPGNVENMGTISLAFGNSAITVSGGTNVINYEKGVIDITDTDYGMYVYNGGTLTNLGTIKVTSIDGVNLNPSGGMFVNSNGSASNSGTIIVDGPNANAMGSNGSVSISNASDGTITINNGSTNSYAFYLNGGSAVNNGTINLGDSGLLTTNGNVFNYGNIIAPNGVKNGPNGSLVMEQGGTTSTPLKEATIGLSYASTLYTKNDSTFTPTQLTFTAEKIDSYSYLYEINTDSETTLIRRKNFSEITDNKTGNFLETIYFDSENSSKDQFFNVLRSARNSYEYNFYLDKFLGRSIYPNIMFQTKNVIAYATENIVENLDKKLVKGKDDSYIVGYTFEKFRQKGFDHVEGYDENLNGFYLGKQFYLNEVSDFGVIFSYTRLDSDYYSNAGKREDNFLQGTAFINYNNNNKKGIGTFYLGYSKGNVKRDLNLSFLDFKDNTPTYSTINENYKGDLKNFYLGTSGKLSKQYNFTNFFIEPEISAYAMGVFQHKIKESSGEYELEIDKLNNFFSKINTNISIGKVFYPSNNYTVTFKLLAGLGQEINSSNNDLDVSFKNISNENSKLNIDRKNNFSQELGAKVDIAGISNDSLSFYIDYKYIFEKDDSWKIGTGLNYRF